MTSHREVVTITHADGTVVRVTVESEKLAYAKHVADGIRDMFSTKKPADDEDDQDWLESLLGLASKFTKGPKG